MSRKSTRVSALLLVAFGALALVLAVSGGATSAASLPPAITSFTSSVKTLPPEGGQFSLLATVEHGATCTFTVDPALAGFPKSIPCSSGAAAAAHDVVVKGAISGNPSGRALKYVFSLEVTSSAGTATSAAHPSIIHDSYRWNPSARSIGLSTLPSAVSCAGPTFCMIVGARGAVTTVGGPAAPRRFTVDRGAHTLTDVSCADTVCMVLDDAGRYLVWDGAMMSRPKSFSGGGRKATLTSVSCPVVTFCMAVGDGGAAASLHGGVLTDRSAVGQVWKTAPRRVSCASSRSCLVVTGAGDGFGWDGSTWTSLGLVDPGGDASGLSCASDGTCTIADRSGPAVTIRVTGGSTWTGAPSDSPPTGARAIACPTSHYCLALDGNGLGEQDVANVWSPPFIVGNDRPVLSSCSRGVATPVGSLCVALSGDGHVEYAGHILRAVTPTCQAAPEVGPVDVSVVPADGTDGFKYAPGQFFEGDSVRLAVKAASSCSGAPTLSYAWTLTQRPAGSKASLSSASSPSPSFVADVAGGTWKASVVARDSFGNPSPARVVTLSSGSCGANPILMSVSVAPGSPMDPRSLSAHASSNDDDGAKCPSRFQQSYSYSWSVVSGPGGGDFSDPSAASPTFTPSVPGTYVVKTVAVGKGSGVSGTALTTIDASCAAPTVSQTSIVEVNGAPYGGQPVSPGDGLTVGADATSACTASQPTFKYQWQLQGRPLGSSAKLSSATAAAPKFTPDIAGTYDLAVVVTDPFGQASDPATLQVAVSACSAAPQVGPVDVSVLPADGAGGFVYAQGQFFTGDTVGLKASASSSCSAAQSLTYAWTLTQRPAGSTAALSSASSPTPSFVADVAGGTWEASVVVTDSLGNTSAPASVTLSSGSCGANPVTVSASVVAPPGMPMDPYSLSASASSDDDDTAVCPARFQQSYSYSWSVVVGPDGGDFSNPNSSSPTFTPSVPGTYILEVFAVGDSSGTGGTAQVMIDASCSGPTITNMSITELNGAGYGGEQIVPGDTLTLGADATSGCTATPPSLTYQWQLTGRPAGSSAALSSATDAAPKFTPDVPGTYNLSVVVTDPYGQPSDPSTLEVIVAPVDRSSAPILPTGPSLLLP